MIPAHYRYEMVKKWCIDYKYKLEHLSEDLFGTTTRISKLKKLSEKNDNAYDAEWDTISEFTGLNFNDPLECDELRTIITYLMRHLDRYGNTVLSEKLYKCFKSVDLLGYLEEQGYKVKISFVSHPHETSVIFQLETK